MQNSMKIALVTHCQVIRIEWGRLLDNEINKRSVIYFVWGDQIKRFLAIRQFNQSLFAVYQSFWKFRK
jgi:hypothetical protein